MHPVSWGSCLGADMLIDRKTGARVQFGDWIVRRNYKGFPSRYQLGEFDEASLKVKVQKLMHDDSWRALDMPIASLQLDWVVDKQVNRS